MRFPRKRGATSVMVRVFIPDNSSSTGAGKTGLTSASTNLVIAYARSLAAAVSYTGANIETIATPGTYSAPTSSSYVRFGPVDATNMPGLYELQFHDSATAFGTGDASDSIVINIYETSTTALNIGPNMALIPLSPWDYQTGLQLDATGSVAFTESYATDGAAATLPQLLYMIYALLGEKSITSTTLTAKKLDGSTTAGTFTLNSATAPTSITRAS
jgi:hypothetical protein